MLRTRLILEQALTHPGSRELADAFGLTTPDFDGVAVIEVESFDRLPEVSELVPRIAKLLSSCPIVYQIFTSQEYAEKIVPDEAKFLNRPECQLLVQNIQRVFGA